MQILQIIREIAESTLGAPAPEYLSILERGGLESI